MWLEMEIDAAFQNFGAGAAIGAADKVLEYAKRVLAGEAIEKVLVGLNPNGAFWNSVVKKLQELQGQNPANSQSLVDSLRGYEQKVRDPNWHHLYEIFERIFGRQPQSQEVQQLGAALSQAAQTNNMKLLSPFVEKYLNARRV